MLTPDDEVIILKLLGDKVIMAILKSFVLKNKKIEAVKPVRVKADLDLS